MVRTSLSRHAVRAPLLGALALLLGLAPGCDKDRTGSGLNNGQPSPATRIEGTVQAGPVRSATVIAFGITADGRKDQTLGQTSTDGDGRFQLAFNPDTASYQGAVLIEATGGRYLDEATGQDRDLNVTLRAFLPALPQDGSSAQVNVTALTSVATTAAESATGGLNATNGAAAKAAVEALFGGAFDILATPLLDVTRGAAAGDAASVDVSLALAGVSQLAVQLNLDQNELIRRLLQDAADGVLDGIDAQGQVVLGDGAVTFQLLRAIRAFVAGPNNAASLSLQGATEQALAQADGGLTGGVLMGLDTRAPRVLARFPRPGATAVPINSRVYLQFNEALDPASVDATTIQVRSNGMTVPGSLTYDAASKTAVFVAIGVLPINARVQVSATTGLRDQGGNPLARAENFSFTTSALSQGGQGFLTSVSADPAAATTVSASAVAVITAGRAFDPTSLRQPNAVTLVTSGSPVDVVIGSIAGASGFTVVPVQPLTAGATYTLTIGGQVTDAVGNQLGQAFQVNFSALGSGSVDAIAPRVGFVVPANNDSQVLSRDSILVAFNEAMSSSSVIANTQLLLGASPVDVTVRFSSQSNLLEVTPRSPLQVGQTYTLQVGTGAQDLAGNGLASAFTSSFTVQASELTFLTTQLPDAVQGQSYSQRLQTEGGVAPVTFALAQGSQLPPGLSLNSPNPGDISGTPSAAGTAFTIIAMDSSSPPQTAQQSFTIAVVGNVQTPTLSFAQSQLATMDESAQTVSVTVRLATPAALTSAVTARVSDSGQGTATSGLDYAPFNPATVTFPAGSQDGATRSFNLSILDDGLFEGPETVILSLDNVQGAGAVLGGASSLTVTITDDDVAPMVSLDAGNVLSLSEGAMGSLGLTLSNTTTADVTVPFTVSGSASGVTDHDLVDGQVLIPAGQLSGAISFNVLDDLIDEDDVETLTVSLGTPTNAVLGAIAQQTVSLNDNDDFAVATITGPGSVSEGGGPAVFTVTLTPPHARTSAVSVDLMTQDGSAIAGIDYGATQTTLSFAAGEMSQTVSVLLADDTLDEDDESFSASLGNGQMVRIGSPAMATATITDNDNPPSVSFTMAAQSVSEGVGQVELRIALDNPDGSGKTITVPFTVDGASTAQNPADHDLMSGVFPDIPATTMAPGQTESSVFFSLVDDALSELPETIVVVLGMPMNATLGGTTTQTVTILDNEGDPTLSLDLLDGAGAVLAPNPANNNRSEVVEGAGLVMARASLSNPASRDVSFDLALTGATTASQPRDNSDLDSPTNLVRVYIARNASLDPATVTAVTPFRGVPYMPETRIQSFAAANNEGIAVTTTGDLVQAGDVSVGGTIQPSIRIIANIADRLEGGAFDPQADRIIRGPSTLLVQPKGLDVDTPRGLIVVADFGGTQVLSFDLGGADDVAPLGVAPLTGIAGVTGRPWDVDYDGDADRLFVVVTDGNVLVYDDFVANGYGAAGPSRTFAPAFDSGAGLAKESVNLHGIVYVGGSVDRLLLSDVGSAGSTTDGKLFIVDSASTAGAAPAASPNLAAVSLRIVTQMGVVRLGNPVDIAFDGQTLYVSEKTSDGADANSILIYDDFLNQTAMTTLAPTATLPLPVGTGPESIALDTGLRRDFDLAPQTVTIPAGQLTATLSFRLDADLRDEDDEVVGIALQNLVNAVAGTVSRELEIQDDDAEPTIEVLDASATEGDDVVFTVQLSRATGRGAQAQFTTADGTAIAPSDYLAQGTTLLDFQEGERIRLVRVATVDDMTDEPTEESFALTLDGNPSNATPLRLNAVGRILDNDNAPTIDLDVMGQAAISEAAGAVSVTVRLDAPSGLTVTANLSLTAVSPTFGGGDVSFSPNPQALTFAPGQTQRTVTFTVNDDMVNEADEAFSLSLQSISNAMPGMTSATLTIVDNDALSLNLASASNGSEMGPQAATFTAMLNRASEQSVSFALSATGSGNDPVEAGDISAPATLSFAPGQQSQTVAVSVVDDNINEADEGLTLSASLQGVVNGFDMGASTLSADALVADNDTLTVSLARTQDGAEMGPAPARFTASLNVASEQTVGFTVSVAGSGPDGAEAGDFSAPTDLDVVLGAQSAVLDVAVLDDMVNEAHEGLTASLTLKGLVRGFDAQASTLSASAQILDDDILNISIAAQGATQSLIEDQNANQLFDVSLDRASEQSFTLNFAFQPAAMGPSATLGSDLQLPAQTTLSFAGTAASPVSGVRTITVNLIEDLVNEANEAYQIGLSFAAGASNNIVVSAMPATAIILDDDDLSLSLSLTQAGMEGGAASFEARLSRLSEQLVVTSVAAAGGAMGDPAEVGDFDLGGVMSLTFNAGEQVKALSLGLVDDMVNEANESVTVSLALQSVVRGFVMGASTLEATTLIGDNDDAVASIAVVGGPGFVEGGGATVGFTVSLSLASEQSPAFDVMTAETMSAPGFIGNATSGVDFTAQSVTLTFNGASQSESTSVQVIGDADAEQNETFQALLSLNTQAGTPRGVSVGVGAATATIEDDDDARVDLVAGTPTVEGGVTTVELRLSGPKSEPVIVTVGFDQAASSAADPAEVTDFETSPSIAPVDVYVALNGGTKVVDRLVPGRDLSLGTLNVGGNEGVVLDTDGNLYQAGEIGASPAIRIFAGVVNRPAGSAFDVNRDVAIRGASTGLTTPKGIDVDTRRGLIFVADNGAQRVLVFRTTDSGDASPTGVTDLGAAPWDVDYEPVADRLFVAMTDGRCLVFDDYVAGGFAASGLADRTIIPAVGGVADSTNLHGIDYDASADELRLSDVGLAGDATDGRLYIIRGSAGVIADGLGTGGNTLVDVDVRVGGPMSQLGNPVDILTDNAGRLYVAEKANNKVLIFDLATLPANGDIAPTVMFDRDRPESLTFDFGLRRDTDFNSLKGRDLNFSPGETSKTISYQTFDDTRHEGSVEEQVALTATVVLGPAVVGNGAQSYAITDNDAQPTISLTAVDTLEGNPGDPQPATVRFFARLDAASGTTPSGSFQSLDGTATTADNDYLPLTTSVSFQEGQAVAVFEVQVVGDDVPEDDETVQGQLSSILLASPAGPLTASARILNDDNVRVISVADAASVTEDGGLALSYTVSLDSPSGQDVTVEFSTTGGTAQAGADYTAVTSQLVTIPAGQSSAMVQVAVLADGVNEDDETVMVSLANPVNAILGAAMASGTILDDDDITVSIASAMVSEGDQGSVTLAFPLSLSGPTEQNVQVSYSTDGSGTATAGPDYMPATGLTANFGAGNTSATAAVQVQGEVVNEANETFGVVIDSVLQGRGVTIGNGAATGTITDDDPITIALAAMDPAPVVEGDAPGAVVSFQVEVSGKAGTQIGQDLSVTFMTQDGSALAGNDFVAPVGGQVDFLATAPATTTLPADVALIADDVNEATQSFSLLLTGLTGSTNGVSLGAKTQATGTITDDDPITLDLVAVTPLVEGNAGTTTTTLMVTRSGATEQSIGFDFEVAESSPTSARGQAPTQDFIPDAGSRTIDAATMSVNIPVVVVGDLLDELDESLQLRLSGIVAEGVTFGASGQASLDQMLVIADDDLPPSLAFDLAGSQLSVPENEVDGLLTLRFVLGVPSGRTVTADLAFADLLATATGPRPDYTDLSQTLSFAPGQTSLTVDVPITNDMVNEADETFTATISNAMGAVITGGMSQQTLTIVNDDVLELSIADAVITEPDGDNEVTLNLQISINRDTEQVVQAVVTPADNTALFVGQDQGDYDAVTGSVTFDGVNAFGTRTQTFSVEIRGDTFNGLDINEPEETFTVSLSNVNVPTTLAKATATVTIFDNDELEISVEDDTYTEGDEGELRFRVAFNRPSEQVIILNTSFDTNVQIDPAELALNADVMLPATNQLVFPELVTEMIVMVDVNDDDVNEANEALRFVVTLTGSPDNVTVLKPAGVGTILDNDDIVIGFLDGVTVIESAGVASPVIALTDPNNFPQLRETEQSFSVTAQTQPAQVGNPAQGDLVAQTNPPLTDYLVTTRTLSFGLGQNQRPFDVTIVDNMINERVETFGVSFSPVGMLPRGITLAVSQETVVITDDDIVTVDLRPQGQPINEGSDGSLTTFNFDVVVTGLSTQSLNLLYVVEAGGPTPGTENGDFIASNSSLSVPPLTDPAQSPRTLMATASVIADTINEVDQTFQVRIDDSNFPAGFQLINGTVTATITDDDPVELRVMADTVTVPEAAGPARFFVQLVGTDPTFPATLTEQSFNIPLMTGVAGDTAMAPGDYTAVNQPLSIMGTPTQPEALGNRLVTVAIINDTINEANETVSLQIDAPTPLPNLVTTSVAARTATATILDDDILVVALRPTNATVDESGAPTFQLFAVRNNPQNTATGTEQAFTFEFTTAELSPVPQAQETLDFVPVNTPQTVTTTPNPMFNVSFPTLATTQAVTLVDEPMGARINEPNEDFLGIAANLMMANNVRFVGGAATAQANQTIIDNDTVIFEIRTDGPVNESAGPAMLTVTITGSADFTAQTFSVPFVFNPAGMDAARDGLDYDSQTLMVNPMLSFNGGPDPIPASAAVTVGILNDMVNEANETFTLALGTPVGMTAGVTIGPVGVATQVLADDDIVVFDIAPGLVTANEATSPRTFNLNLNGATTANSTEQVFTVSFMTADGGILGGVPAVAGQDYTATAFTFAFDGSQVPDAIAGRQVSVPITPDAINEATEVFRGTIMLPGPVNNVMINTAQANAFITDDDTVTLQYLPGADNQALFERGNGGQQNATYNFTFTGAAVSQQTITVTVNLADGLTMPSVITPGLAGADLAFNGQPMGTNPLTLTFAPGTNLAQTFNYQVNSLNGSGDEATESFQVLTSTQPSGSVIVAAGSDQLDGQVVDNALLNLNGNPNLAANIRSLTVTSPLGIAAAIAPLAAVTNNTMSLAGETLTAALQGGATLIGDRIQVIDGGNNIAINTGTGVISFSGTPFATANPATGMASVAVNGGAATLSISLMAGATQDAVRSLVRQLGYTDQGAGGGGRQVTASVSLTSSVVPSETRIALITVNGNPVVTPYLDINLGDMVMAGQGGTGAIPVVFTKMNGAVPTSVTFAVTYEGVLSLNTTTPVTPGTSANTQHTLSTNEMDNGDGTRTTIVTIIDNTGTPLQTVDDGTFFFLNLDVAVGTPESVRFVTIGMTSAADAAAAPVDVIASGGSVQIAPSVQFIVNSAMAVQGAPATFSVSLDNNGLMNAGSNFNITLPTGVTIDPASISGGMTSDVTLDGNQPAGYTVLAAYNAGTNTVSVLITDPTLTLTLNDGPLVNIRVLVDPAAPTGAQLLDLNNQSAADNGGNTLPSVAVDGTLTIN